MPPTRDHLIRLALDAIEEATAAAHVGPVPQTHGLALALAWLLYAGRQGEALPRWPFETFWRGLRCKRDHDRWSGLNASANAIYRVLGIARNVERTSEFEGAARAAARLNSSPPKSAAADARFSAGGLLSDPEKSRILP